MDHLRREDASNLELLADRKEDQIDRRGVRIGELGQVADAHEDRRAWVTLSHDEVSFERAREAEPDGLEHRIDAVAESGVIESRDRRVEAAEGRGLIGDHDDLDARWVERVDDADVVAANAQDELRAARGRKLDLARIEAIDRDAKAARDELACVRAD